MNKLHGIRSFIAISALICQCVFVTPGLAGASDMEFAGEGRIDLVDPSRNRLLIDDSNVILGDATRVVNQDGRLTTIDSLTPGMQVKVYFARGERSGSKVAKLIVIAGDADH